MQFINIILLLISFFVFFYKQRNYCYVSKYNLFKQENAWKIFLFPFFSFFFSYDSVILKIATWYNEVILSYFSTFYHELTCQESLYSRPKSLIEKKDQRQSWNFNISTFSTIIFFFYLLDDFSLLIVCSEV